MLNAILHGKKRGTGMEGVRLSKEFNGLEDTLTATVFERLFYLPDKTVGAVLFAKEIWASSATTPSGPLEKVSFWPRQAIVGESKIEPDIVIEFGERVLVVESKRYDFVPQQEHWQLAREYVRAHTLFSGKQVWLLAVGGLQDGRSTTRTELREAVLSEISVLAPSLIDQNIRFAAVAWRDLFSIIYHRTVGMDAHRRLITDIREGLILHGISVEPTSWMQELALPSWRAVTGGITTPPAAFVSGWAALLAPFQPITSPASIFFS